MTTSTLRSMLLGGAVGVAMVASAGTANALDYKLGGVDLVVDTTVSLGAAVRASSQSCDKVSVANGGCLSDNGLDIGANNDDGNINFGAGDFVSAAVKATTDFEARYENFGAFARVKVFYDYINDQETGQNGGSDRYGERSMSDARRGDDFLNAGAHDISLLDAFVFANFTVAGDLPLTIRVGQQVNNWGESLVIGGGINSYLSFDVGALRTPGAELKEAVLPALSAYASIGLPNNFNLEGWYAWRHDEVKLDNCGTFFSGTDTGCNGAAYVMNGPEYSAAVDALGGYETTLLAGGSAGYLINRAKDDDARDGGEFGVKLGYYAEWLNDGTDIGLYFTNFHSKAPIGTFTSAVEADKVYAGHIGDTCNTINTAIGGASTDSALNCLSATVLGAGLLDSASTKDYLLQYVEDIRMFGASFNTAVDVLGGTALAGEIAYSDNMPYAIADPEINSMDMDKSFTGQAYDAILGGLVTDIDSLVAYIDNIEATTGAVPYASSYDSLVADGAIIPGYKRTEVITAQLQTTSTLPASDPIVSAIGADILILLSNVGMQYLPDLPDDQHFAISRAGDYHDVASVNAILAEGSSISPQYADSFSWGYRLIAVAQYNNFMGSAFTVSPSIQWAHDVNGYSAGPIGPGFMQGKKTISVGATATYQSAYKAEIRYTNSFGNEYRNSAEDKDFASINFSYAF
ncbi:MAG: DUF1302 domain-containing protein [Parvibaculaceae bacterium]|nr:DUF1302 domain-containing protein [Parvibaculaceae bacterium]